MVGRVDLGQTQICFAERGISIVKKPRRFLAELATARHGNKMIRAGVAATVALRDCRWLWGLLTRTEMVPID